MIHLESLLHRIDRIDVLSMFEEESETFDWDRHRSEFYAGFRKIFQDVLAGTFVAEVASAPPDTGMKHLGAFFQLARIMKASTFDTIIWTHIDNFSHVQELIRVVAIIFGLSLERLAAEVQNFYEGTGDQKRFRECFYVTTDMIPSVDAAEVDWERAKQVEFDNTVLEELVNHPSFWLKELAARVLDARMSETERFNVCRCMLQDGRNKTLHIAARMAGKLPDNAGHKLILARLRGSLTLGVSSLFKTTCRR